jgi:uncharacterized protein YycO
MYKKLAGVGLGLALMCATPSLAHAAPGDSASATDAATNAALIEKANKKAIVADSKGGRVAMSAGANEAQSSESAALAPYGSYPTRKGVILVTPDAFKGLIPTGHAAIIYSTGTVVESLSNGVVTGSNNWKTTKKQAYGVTVGSTSATQDSTAANWAYGKRGKPYNWNYLDTGTRAKFYCSHLVWASFKDNFGIDLNTSAWLGAIHPMELVDTPKTNLLWRKA